MIQYGVVHESVAVSRYARNRNRMMQGRFPWLKCCTCGGRDNCSDLCDPCNCHLWF